MLSVRPETVWERVVEVSGIVVQSASHEPSCFLYSQRLSVALPPVSEEATVSLPVPTFAVIVGVAGFGGRVGNADAVSSSVAQVLSL